MRVTVEEIARIAGVSKATVSRVLNSAPGVGAETRERVQRIIDRMHYSTQEGQLKALSRSIALVVPDISNPFFSSIARAVERKAHGGDYLVVLANTDSSEEKELAYISNLVAKKMDGIILVPSGNKCREGHLLPQKYGIPMILLDRKLEGYKVNGGVYSDNHYASFRACEVLIRHGAERIVFIAGPSEVTTSKERLSGYRTAVKQYGAVYSEDLICMGDYTAASGYQAVMDLEQAGVQYSAILAANDLMALGALDALKEFSYQVPAQIELMGFDNIPFSNYTDPPLSTIQQPTAEMGIKAVEMLFQLICKKGALENIYLQPKLLLRKTTR